MRTTHHHRLALALATTLTLAAACDDGDDSADLAFTAAGCDAYAAIGASMFGDPSAVPDHVQVLVGDASDDLDEAATTYGDTLLAVFDGNEDAMASPEFIAADQQVGEAIFDSCEAAAKLDVQGVDFAFEGIPDEIDAGRAAIRFTNDTEHGEAHEMFVVQHAEGFDEPVTALLDMSEDEVFANVIPTAVAYADDAGGTNVALVDLQPGQYIAICMIPTEGNGAPHAVNGMVTEFTVG